MVCTSPVASTMRCGLPRLDSTMLDSSLEKPTLSAWDRSAGKASISAVRTLTTTTPFALGAQSGAGPSKSTADRPPRSPVESRRDDDRWDVHVVRVAARHVETAAPVPSGRRRMRNRPHAARAGESFSADGPGRLSSSQPNLVHMMFKRSRDPPTGSSFAAVDPAVCAGIMPPGVAPETSDSRKDAPADLSQAGSGGTFQRRVEHRSISASPPLSCFRHPY